MTRRVLIAKRAPVAVAAYPGGPALPPDTVRPSTPSNLQSSGIGQNSFTLTWTSSTDNVLVAGYNVFRGGVKVNTNLIPHIQGQTTHSTTVSGLTPSTAYLMTVVAVDTAGNESFTSPALSVTTAAAGGSAGVTLSFPSPERIDMAFTFGDGNSPNLAFKLADHSYYVHNGNYGLNIVVGSLRPFLVKDILLSGNVWSIWLAGRLMPGDQVSVSFASTSRSPVRADNSAIPPFNATSTYSAAFTGQVYYVSTAGNDNNSGSQGAPWASIAKVNSAAIPANSTVIFEAGTYTGTLNQKNYVTYISRGGTTIDGNGSAAAVFSQGIVGSNMRGIRAINRNTGFGNQGFRWRDCDQINVWNCVGEQSSNNFFGDGTGNIVLEGCYARAGYNSNIYFDGYSTGPERENITVRYCVAHANITNDDVSFHSDGDSSAGSIGTLGKNILVESCHFYDCPSEELADITTGGESAGRLIFRNNWLHDCSGAFVAIAWSAQYVDVYSNFMESDLPGEKIPTAFIYTRVNDVRIYRNIFKGTVRNPFSGNTRAHIMLVGSNQIATENPERIAIWNNTFVLKKNEYSTVGLTPLVLQFLSLADRPNPSDYVQWKNNLVVMTAADGHANAVIEFADIGIFAPSSPVYDADYNYYSLASSAFTYELTQTNTTLAVFRSTYSKELNSVDTDTAVTFAAGTGPEAYKLPAGSPLAGQATTPPDYVAADFFGRTSVVNAPGACIVNP